MWKKYRDTYGFNKLYDDWILELYNFNCSDVHPELLSNNISDNIEIKSYDYFDFEEILKFDKKIISEYDRTLYLKMILAQKDTITKVQKP